MRISTINPKWNPELLEIQKGRGWRRVLWFPIFISLVSFSGNGGSSNFVYGGRNSGRLSSASNLSASALPFTVDRSSGKSFSDNRFPITDSYYSNAPEGWQYPQPSAPVSESVMDSTEIASSNPLPREYQFFGSAYVGSTAVWSPVIPADEVSGIAHGYDSTKSPSYGPSVPMFDGDHDMKLEGEGSRATTFSYAPSSFDLGYGLQEVGGYDFHVDKHAKIVEPGGNFSSAKVKDGCLKVYSNQTNQRAPAVYMSNEDCWQDPAIQKHKYQHAEGSNLSYQQSDEFSGREVSMASCNIGNVDKGYYPGEKRGSFPYYFSKSRIPDTSSAYNLHGASKVEDINEDFSTWNVTSCFTDANSARPLVKSPVSAVRSPSGVIITPPPAAFTERTGKKHFVHEAASTGSSNYRFAVDSYQSNMSKLQELGVKPSSETQKDSYEARISKFPAKVGGCISSSSQGMPDRFVQGDFLGSTTDSRVRSQASESDSSDGPSMHCNMSEAVKSYNDSSNIADDYLEVDSPCWKGAPSSNISFSDFDYSGCNLVKKALDEVDELEHGKHQVVNHSVVEPRFTTFEKASQNINGNKSECIDDTGIDRMKDFEVKIPELMDATEEEASGMVVNDAFESESTAVHEAEEALSSPVSQEDAAEHTVRRDSRLNVATMIKALHNISELLLVHFSSDADSMENQNIEDVEKVISNLNSCLNKKQTSTTKEPESGTLEGGISHLSRESLDLNKVPETPVMVEESIDLQNEPMIQHKTCSSRNYSFSCEKDHSSYVSVTGTHSLVNDNVAKGIKKVLEENFDFNEEMQAPAFLFKNLWLEAEAKLCSLTLKANFNRMKIQMEEIQLKASPEIEDHADVIPKDSSNRIITPSELHTQKDQAALLVPKPNTQSISMLSTSVDADDIESSVMARFNILKSRKETVAMEEEQKTETSGGNPEDSFMASLRPLKSPAASILSIGKEKELISKGFSSESDYQKHFDLGFQPEDETMIHNSGFGDLDDFYLSSANHPTAQSSKNGDLGSRNNSGLHGSFSLDWEHVFKDECLWRNS